MLLEERARKALLLRGRRGLRCGWWPLELDRLALRKAAQWALWW